MWNKAKAISAELFELNLKVQLCNLVTVWLREVIFKKKNCFLSDIVQKGEGGPTQIQKFWGSFFWAFFWTFSIEGGHSCFGPRFTQLMPFCGAKTSKVRPQLSFLGTTKPKTVLKPEYHKV